MTAHPRALRVVVLASGSAGNACLVEADGCGVLVDAGISADAIARGLESVGLNPRDLAGILLTHEHEDHARAAGPLGRAFGIPVFANAAAAAASGAALEGTALRMFETATPFDVGPFTVTAFAVPHDAAEPVGFTLATPRRRVTVATDLGSADNVLDGHLAAADLVILESNYDLRLLSVSAYPWFLKNRILSGRGHLSNDDAARAIARTAGDRARTVCLVHLSEVNNLASLARDIVRAALVDVTGVGDQVRVVPPNGRSGPIVLD
jgi:phosphoribosyl 1,2-cyclic phosphodiesterase